MSRLPLPVGARNDLEEIGRALNELEALIPKQDYGEFDLLAARIDALRFQLNVVNELLRVMVQTARGDNDKR